MAGRLKYGPRYRYPHMMEDEIRIWEKFMDQYPGRFETVDYDFRVGAGAEVPEDIVDPWARMATMLSQKRIDVIGWVDESPTIIEIKHRVGLSALGQILGYKTLFMHYFKHFGKPDLLIVCGMISEDDQDVLDDNHVEAVVV